MGIGDEGWPRQQETGNGRTSHAMDHERNVHWKHHWTIGPVSTDSLIDWRCAGDGRQLEF